MKKLLITSLVACMSVQAKPIELSLKALLDLKTGIASGEEEMTLRESPGIISVISDQDIRRMGATDLRDVLERIPGFQLGTDVQGVEGLGIRSIWANEGKVLLLVDGMEVNERLFSSIWLGGHYPLHAIQKIEVIRGPGSALYGGYAELGVINIITKTGERGISLAQNLEQAEKGWQPWNSSTTLGLSQSIGGLGVSAQMNWTNFYPSQLPYKDLYGQESQDLHNNQSLFAKLKLSYGNFNYDGLLDYYKMNRTVSFTQALAQSSIMMNNQMSHRLSYEHAFDDVKLLSKISWRRGLPWETPWTKELEAVYQTDGESPYGIQTDDYSSDLLVSWDVRRNLNLQIGNHLSYEKEIILTDSSYFVPAAVDPEWRRLFAELPDSVPRIRKTMANFAQFIYRSDYGNFIGGLRHEISDYVDQSLVPRFAYTKTWDKFHWKLLASKAFRAPAFENGSNDASIKIAPENTTVYESEFGYVVDDYLNVNMNLFRTNIQKPIIYGYVNGEATYKNVQEWGSSGLELSSNLSLGDFRASADWSYSQALLDDQEIKSLYGSPLNSDQSLAFANYKWGLRGDYQWDSFHLGADLLYTGARDVISGLADTIGTEGSEQYSVAKRLDPNVMLNAYVSYRPSTWQNGNLTLGAKNILDQSHVSAQPYNGWKAPESRLGRSYFANLELDF